MARRGQSGHPNYDSLLDTMTNLIGILVILLGVTQLGVRDVVRRVSWELPDVSVGELEQAEKRVERLKRSVTELEVNLAGHRASGAITDVDLESATQALEQAEALVQSLTAQNAEHMAYRERQQQLRASIDHEQSEIADLQAQLADLSTVLEVSQTVEMPTEEDLHLPDPRPTGPGATPVFILCRHGRVAPAYRSNLESFARLQIESEHAQLLHEASDRVGRSVYDPAKVVQYFQRNEIATRDFRLSVALDEKTGGERLLVTVKPTGGESVRELVAPGSRYRSAISQIDPTTQYVQFVVWPDSFEAYIVARRIVQQNQLPAGWALQLADQRFLSRDLGIALYGELKPTNAHSRAQMRPNVLD